MLWERRKEGSKLAILALRSSPLAAGSWTGFATEIAWPTRNFLESAPLSEYGFAYGLKAETCQFSTNFSCEPHGEGKETYLSEYRSITVSIVSKYSLGWSSQVVSTVWIGSEYGFSILLDESASESHTQNSTRTAPY